MTQLRSHFKKKQNEIGLEGDPHSKFDFQKNKNERGIGGGPHSILCVFVFGFQQKQNMCFVFCLLCLQRKNMKYSLYVTPNRTCKFKNKKRKNELGIGGD